jgi:hypothetical protein
MFAETLAAGDTSPFFHRRLSSQHRPVRSGPFSLLTGNLQGIFAISPGFPQIPAWGAT